MFDSGILKLLQKNPEKGLSVLMDQYTPLVYTIVKNKLVGCASEDIEETVSDVFIAFYRQIDKVDLNKGKLSAYLTTIAKRKAIDKLRTLNQRYELSTDEDFIEIPDGINLESEAERRALNQRLVEEIYALGEPDTSIILLKYFLAETSEEIAKQLSLSAANVRQRAARALKKLEIKLKGDYYEI